MFDSCLRFCRFSERLASFLAASWLLSAPSVALADTVLAAAVLPGSRSVQVDAPASLFVTLINGGAEAGDNCRIEADAAVPATLSYQTTDPATNQPTGTVNTPVNIAPGAFQSFVIVLTPTAEVAPTEVALGFVCDNAPQVARISGVNTFDFSASTTPVADVVALALTDSADGIVAVPTTSQINAFSVASVNLGAAATVEVRALLSDPSLAATLSMCETDPGTGACINPLVPSAAPVTTTMQSMATPTFAVFIATSETLGFDPATSRINVRFADDTGASRGATSVALSSRTLEAITPAVLEGITTWSAPVQPGEIAQVASVQTFASDGSGTTFERASNFQGVTVLASRGSSFTWTLTGSGELDQQFENFQFSEPGPSFDLVGRLVASFGIPLAPAQFLQDQFDNGPFAGPFEVENQILSRSTTANSESSGIYNVTTTTTSRFTIDAMLQNNGWTEPLPVGTPQKSSQSEQLVSAPQLQQPLGQTATSGQTWAFPFPYAPQDPSVSSSDEGYFVDAVTLLADGTTTAGRLSGESFNWENQGNTLVFTNATEEHRITTTDVNGRARAALIEYRLNNTPIIMTSRSVALGDSTGADLAADLVRESPLYWQVGIDSWRQSMFRDDGLLAVDSIFGYQFIDANSSNRLLGVAPNGSGCPDESVGCIRIIPNDIWSWTSSGNLIARTRASETSSLRLRTRTWEVLSYVAGGPAIVVESAVWTFDGQEPEFVIEPRLNSLTLEDLRDWQVEFANSPDFN